jgi:hypothetical protein
MSIQDVLRRQFENQEAIYVEVGVLRVRVFNIHLGADERSITADVEEIPTIGLGVGMYRTRKSLELQTPIRSWHIRGGFLTSFSDNTWSMGYGGWTLFFDKKIVEGVVSLAAGWPNERSESFSRYDAGLEWLQDNRAYVPEQQVFPDE